MKKVIILFFTIISNLSNAQVKYHFDYALLYEEMPINEEPTTITYLINSNQNNYFMGVFKKNDSINLNIHFSDYNGLFSRSLCEKKMFFKAETINNDCSSVFKGTTIKKDKLDSYSFEKLDDTLIKDTMHYHFVIKSLKSKKYQKRNNIVSYHFIIDKYSPQFMPFFYHHTVFSVWKENPIVPNGLIKMIYYTDFEEKITGKTALKKVVKTDKYLTIPEECDYTKSPK